MENTPPIHSDRNNWSSLPTLSQLTRNRQKSLSNRQNSEPLMAASSNHNYPQDKWEDTSGLLTPPSSQQTQRDATTMLISPPPEEVLRSTGRGHHKQGSAGRIHPFTPSILASGPRVNNTNSKRKRPGVVTSISAPVLDSSHPDSSMSIDATINHEPDDHQPPEATPNPKPRKQSKRHARTQSLDSPTRLNNRSSPVLTTPTRPKSSMKQKRVLIQSPHALNPDADFIPPIPVAVSSSSHLTVSARALSRRSRSATPIPPYEPPQEVFTPPREVTISPLQAPSSRRKSKAKVTSEKKVEAAKMAGWVKKELPEIDWSTPMPPPSPGDDPLLLSGRPGMRARARASTQSSPTRTSRTRDEMYEEEETMQLGDDNIATNIMDVSMGPEPSTDSSDAAGPILPLFDLSAPQPFDASAGWSDSDSEDELGEGEGEYTGKFTMMTVRTKADPPTSGTRQRMEGWGRPISPFPGAARRFALASVGEMGGEDEEMDELPIIEDDEVLDEEEMGEQTHGPFDFDALEAEVDSEPEDEEDAEEETEIEVARDAADGHELAGDDDDGGYEEHSGAEDQHEGQDVDMHGAEEDESVEEPGQPSFDEPSFEKGENESEEDVLVEQAGLHELHERSIIRESSVPPSDKERDASVSVESPEKSLSFTRELSVEEEEEEEEKSIDRELSREPVDDEDVEEREEEAPVLGGEGEGCVLDTARAYESRQQQRSLSGRWDRPLRIPESVSLASRPQPQEVEDEAADEPMVDDEDGSNSEESMDEGVVTITSNDPLAAARAAAILKLHDYDYLSKIQLKNQRLSHGTPESTSRNARRKSVIESGISKSSASATKRRRSTMGGMIGDHVFIPGSPMMTLPELLKQAEVGLEKDDTVHTTPVKGLSVRRDPFKTPAPRGIPIPFEMPHDETRGWTKDDWKQLDACFTDERLDVAEKLGLGPDAIADVDSVRIDDVVDRFIQMMGGTGVVDPWGSDWDRDSLLTRTQALQKKQRSGNVPPPTPGRQSPSLRLSAVPDFTPITRRRPHPPALRPKLPPPLTDSPFENLASKRPKVHGSLLAPRYSHLLEEAIAVSRDQPETETDTSISTVQPQTADESVDSTISPDDHRDDSCIDDSSESIEQVPAIVGPGISKRVKGFFFSYLPTLSKSALPQKSEKPRSSQPGLPLPPPEVLGKARGPISTPIRPPPPKPIHPKEQVHLQHAPPPKKSALPRPSKPQRLVELHPTPPPPPAEPVPIQRNRRSSGGSVKDLVKNFEHLDNEAVRKPEIKRIRSIGELNGRTKDKPVWRP